MELSIILQGWITAKDYTCHQQQLAKLLIALLHNIAITQLI